MVEFLGMLKVRIVRGINLAVRDLLSSDPYVIAILGGQVLVTLDGSKQSSILFYFYYIYQT